MSKYRSGHGPFADAIYMATVVALTLLIAGTAIAAVSLVFQITKVLLGSAL